MNVWSDSPVTVSGEMETFAPLLIHVKAICENIGAEFAGALLRPYGAAFGAIKKMGVHGDDVYDAAREAGRQLVQDGKMTDEVLATISRQLVPREPLLQATNAFFQKTLDALEKK